MTQEELTIRWRMIRDKCALEENALFEEAIKGCTRYNVGDVISGTNEWRYSVTIKVENIYVKADHDTREPHIVYEGRRCNQDGVVSRHNQRYVLYEHNVDRLNRITY